MSDLPSTLAKDTIYAQVNDADNPTEIETLYIAGLEFVGGIPAGTPAITKPSGTTINLGENNGSGVSKSIGIKANSHITGDLTVGLAANSDLSFDTSNLPSGVTYNSGAGTLTIAQATAMQGVNITIVYSGSGAAEIDGGLVISGGGASPKSVVVVVEKAWQEITISNLQELNFWMDTNSKFVNDAAYYKSALLPINGETQIRFTANENYATHFAFFKQTPVPSGGQSIVNQLCTGETGRRSVNVGETETFTIPSGCACVVINTNVAQAMSYAFVPSKTEVR